MDTTTVAIAGGERRGLRPLPLLALLAVLVALPLSGAAATTAEAAAEAVDYCLACHEDDSLTLDLDDGASMSLFVDREAWQGSVHGGELVCTDCHQGYESDDVHPAGATFPDRRHYELELYEACKRCHFETYTRTLESIHFAKVSAGDPRAPVCTDCHGAHAIFEPHAKDAMMSGSCAGCHEYEYAVYAQSVHGAALLQEGVEDVPSCADCHTAHSVRDAGTAAFRVASPGQCVTCHGDEEMMARYGLSSNVARSYLTDFHGATATLADPERVEERHLVVTCADCHGVHNIRAVSEIRPEEMKQRVAAVCSDCHEGASADFSAAWLSHYEPSLSHAPLVFIVDLFYKGFIPFLIGGLVLQVGLHFYRFTRKR